MRRGDDQKPGYVCGAEHTEANKTEEPRPTGSSVLVRRNSEQLGK